MREIFNQQVWLVVNQDFKLKSLTMPLLSLSLMVLLDLICISFLGVCSSCLCMFFMLVNYEKPIPYFNLFIYLFIYSYFGRKET